MNSIKINRKLPTLYSRCFLLATRDEIGNYGLEMLLRQVRLDRFKNLTPQMIQEMVITASEFAELQQSVRDYYGLGAHGLLNRIGRGTWIYMVKRGSFQDKVRMLLTKLWPRSFRSRKALEYLAAGICGIDGCVSVHLYDQDLLFLDQTSDTTYGQITTEPICWVTTGMIQGVLSWAMGEEPDIEEISCRATGSEDCKFKVRL